MSQKTARWKRQTAHIAADRIQSFIAQRMARATKQPRSEKVGRIVAAVKRTGRQR